MTTPYRLLLCATAALAAAVAGAVAADRTAPPVTGHVLVLDNERTVEGDIEQVGDQYRVRRAIGETWLPAQKVLRLCTDMEAAYQFLRTRANLGDPDECLRLARWCHSHGLAAQALQNVAAAVKLDPNHAEARRLLAGLRRAVSAQPVASAAPAEVPQTAAAPELNTEARAVFATKVEPILMNACAGCHTGSRGGSFRLTHNYEASSLNRVSMQQNLSAVLREVNLEQPQESKLLVKALTAHDPQARQAPLNSKTQIAAYHTLEDWVQTTVAANPHLRDQGALPSLTGAPKAAAPTPSPKPVAAAPTAKPADPAGTKPAAGGFATVRPKPARTTPVDEFDPVLFNRQGKPPDDSKDDDDNKP